MPPCQSLQDDFFLHHLVRDRALARPLDHEEVARRRMAGGVAHHALGVVAQVLGPQGAPRRRQVAGRGNGHERHPAQVEPFDARVSRFHTMQNQVGIAFQQSFPRPGHGFEMQVQSRGRPLRKELSQQAQQQRARAEVADHHVQFAFLAHGQLLGMRAQAGQFAQQGLGAPMKRLARRGGLHPVAAPVEQLQVELPLQLGDRREDRGMRAMQCFRRRLEAALAHHRVKALQVVQGKFAHVGNSYNVCANFVISLAPGRNYDPVHVVPT